MKKKLFISIIINCYNGEKYLSACLKSILSQTYQNFEVIFWDNCSTDNSKSIAKSFSDKRIKFFRSKNFLSLYQARNEAVKKSKGDYISFLDVDDYWSKKKLMEQVKFLNKNRSYEIVYSNFYTVFKKKKLIANNYLLPTGKITEDLLKTYCIGILTVLIKSDIIKKEKFNKKYNIIGDFDFFIKISLKKKIGCIQKPLAYYRVHKNNLSKRKIGLHINELSNWIKKNQNFYKKLGISLNYIKFFLLKLRVKYFLTIIGRIVQW